MPTDQQKTKLLADFQCYLEHNALEPLSKEQPDLNTLLSELIGLKTEVKIESKQLKNTIDSLNSALKTLQTDNQALSDALIASKEQREQQQTEITRTLLLEIVDIYDRLNTGTHVLQNYQPVNALFNHSKAKDIAFIQRIEEGQTMTLNHFEQLLQRYQVNPIHCTDQLFDPLTMNAVEIACHTQLKNGIVLEELRKGFLYQNQVLRLAEVKVNKLNNHPLKDGWV